MNSEYVPVNCNVCHDREWCDSYYAGLGCNYKDAICRKANENLRKIEEEKMKEIKEDVVKEPSHYKHGLYETIDEMLLVFGPQRTYDYCIIAAWKYRARAAYKENFEQDMKKADEYLLLAKQIAEANLNHFYGGPITLIKEK